MSATRHTFPKEQKTEFIGAGCVVQTLGIILGLFLGATLPLIGTVLAVALVLAGSAMSVKWVCGGCRNKVEKDALICPACRNALKPAGGLTPAQFAIGLLIVGLTCGLLFWLRSP